MPIFTQILLSIVVLSLTFLVAVAGFQVIRLLQDFRLTLQKLDNILSHTQVLSEASAKPVVAVNEFFSEVKTLVNQTQDEIIDSTPDRVITHHQTPVVAKKTNRFFHRSGLPLRPS